MKQLSLAVIMLSSALFATPEATTLSEVFSKAKVSGNIKYYYIQTDKDRSYTNQANTSANANSIGGQFSFNSASFYGFSGGTTFMTTNPFLLNSNASKVDTSIIGRDNGVRLATGLNAPSATTGFSVLGEVYLTYAYDTASLTLGRKVIKTPFINAKEVRMLPSSVEGAFAAYGFGKKSKVEVAYLDKFKQRTSNRFTDMYQHALGTNTQAITGKKNGSVFMAGLNYQHDDFKYKVYDNYASDFMNSLYIDGSYKMDISSASLNIGAQFINQISIGNADTNLKNATLPTGGKAISANMFGLKAVATLSSAKFGLMYTNVLRDKNSHDSLVLPWDGTPLFTNMITSNDLFQSNYGKALQADSIYIGGAQGIKLLYNQKFDSLGAKGFSTTLSYLNTSFDRGDAPKNQNDYNIVLQYKAPKAFTLQLKGIWVQNNTGASSDGTITQLKLLSQYRVIANYKF